MRTNVALTSYTGKKLPSEALYVRARKGHEGIRLEEIEDALTEQIRDDTDMVSEVEAITKMNALVPVVLVVLSQRD